VAGRVRVRGRDGSNNPIPVPVPDFWLSGKTRTRTHTRSTRVLPVKVGTNSGGYPWVWVFLPCLGGGLRGVGSVVLESVSSSISNRRKHLLCVWMEQFSRRIHFFKEFKIIHDKIACLDKIF